jgi:hypothetical protein
LEARQQNPYQGITYIPFNGKYEAHLGAQHTLRTIGHFDTLEDAMAARGQEVARLISNRSKGKPHDDKSEQ